MTWDMNQNRFALRQGSIENELKSMKKYKIPNNKTYERFYDEQLGALNVYIILENTAALESPSRFLRELKQMRNENPLEQYDAYQQERVVSGWQKTLGKLIKEFEHKL